MNIKGAIAHAEFLGQTEVKEKIADTLWPTSSVQQRMLNLNNLISGRVKSIKVDWVSKICDICKVDANYLFNDKK